MGQNQSQETKEQTQQTGPRSVGETEVFQEERHCFGFCGIGFRPGASEYTSNSSQWRKEIISQLENLDVPNWPKLLIELLKSINNNRIDKKYQSEVFWVDENYERLNSHKSVSRFLKATERSKLDESINETFENSPSRPNNDPYSFREVKDLFNTSEIIDDKVLEPQSPLPYKYKKRNTIDSGNKQTTPSIEENLTPIATPKRSTTSRYSISYQNNLLISQVPLVNGMDGRNLSDPEQLYSAVKRYKTITSLIMKHAKKEDNIFNQMIYKFQTYFVSQYGDCERFEINSKQKSEQATKDIQQLTVIIYESLSRFYGLANLAIGKQIGQETLFNKNNMLNFAASLVFTDEIHKTIFDLYAFCERNKEQSYQANIQHCASLQPEDFGVPPEFCLNQLTLAAFKDSEKGDGEEAKEIKLFNPEEIIPYHKAIIALRSLKKKQSPVQKLKNIVKVAELVSISIDKFYDQHQLPNDKVLTGDQTLAIFMYILAKSGVENTLSHCKIIESFSTKNILGSVSGYYCITLKAGFNFIKDLELSENQENAKEQFSSSLGKLITSK